MCVLTVLALGAALHNEVLKQELSPARLDLEHFSTSAGHLSQNQDSTVHSVLGFLDGQIT